MFLFDPHSHHRGTYGILLARILVGCTGHLQAKAPAAAISTVHRFHTVTQKGKLEIVEHNVMVVITAKVYFLIPFNKISTPQFHLFDLMNIQSQAKEVRNLPDSPPPLPPIDVLSILFWGVRI